MTEAIISIKQWGNHLGIRLPAAIASEAHLKLNQRVRISVEDDFTPINDAPNTGTEIVKFPSDATALWRGLLTNLILNCFERLNKRAKTGIFFCHGINIFTI